MEGSSPADKVVGMTTGGFAQYALARASNVYPISQSTTFEAAAALPINFVTAYHGLADRAAMKSGETVVVIGAAGGVGSAAIQVAKALDARVVAVASTPAKRDFALAAGADTVMDTEPEGWRDRLKQTYGGQGPDIIFDPVCGPLFEPAFRSLAWRGRHLVVGFVGGPIPALPSNLTR